MRLRIKSVFNRSAGWWMKSRRLLVFGVTAFLGIGSLQATVIPGRWEKVATLIPGSEIAILLKTGDRVEGVFGGLTDHHLTLSRKKNGSIRFQEAEVDRVERLLPEDHIDGTLVGMGVGFGFGLAVGALADSTHVKVGPIRVDGGSAGYLLGGLAGIGIGALAGYLVDRSHSRFEVLYQAP